MTENRRAPRPDVIYVLPAIDIPDFRPGRAIDEKRLTAYPAKRADGRIDAAGNAVESALEKFGRMRSHAGKGKTSNAQRLTSNAELRENAAALTQWWGAPSLPFASKMAG